MIGIVKDAKHSYNDFGLTVRDVTTETKKKNKTLVKIPFMNGSYDFSCLYGGQTYEEEMRVYEFNLIAKDKYDLEIQKMKLSEWLLDGGQVEIYDDLLVGYHRLAECIDLSFEENHNYAKVIANFRAYPFKICDEYEGDDIWDTFNFELDVAQDVKFTVESVKSEVLINNGSNVVTPVVICSDPMTVTLNNKAFKFPKGESKDYRFRLKKGDNSLNIEGRGTIEFKFRKEVL